MIGRETRMPLRHYLAQGASKSALARQLGLSRDTSVDRVVAVNDLAVGATRQVPEAPSDCA